MELKDELNNRALGQRLTEKTHSLRITDDFHRRGNPASWPQECPCGCLVWMIWAHFLQEITVHVGHWLQNTVCKAPLHTTIFNLKKKSLFYFKKNKQALLIILQWPFEIPKAPSLIPSSECLVYPCSLSISEHFPHAGSLTFSYMQVSHTYVYIKFSYFLWFRA